MSLNEAQSRNIEEMRLKIIALEVKVNALEAARDEDEEYRMEQNERR